MINENRVLNEANSLFTQRKFDKALFLYSLLISKPKRTTETNSHPTSHTAPHHGRRRPTNAQTPSQMQETLQTRAQRQRTGPFAQNKRYNTNED